MFRDGISYARLMRESTDRVQIARRTAQPHEQRVASRILADASTAQRWESEHSGLMRRVAAPGHQREQLCVLKQTTFGLIHRKALFETLRDKEVRGVTRMRILTHFHPARSYEHAVIAEHGVYLHSACSFLCSSHIGGEVVHDLEFLDPMQRYEELYAEYLDIYCRTYFAVEGGEAACVGALLPLLKHQLEECRQAILDPRHAMPRFARDRGLRRATGDTQRLNVRGLRAKFGANPDP